MLNPTTVHMFSVVSGERTFMLGESGRFSLPFEQMIQRPYTGQSG
jgi:hypothetical protein